MRWSTPSPKKIKKTHDNYHGFFGGPSRTLDEPLYVVDIIKYCLQPCYSNNAQIAELYEKNGLSAAQVAKIIGVSKATVLNRLTEMNVQKKQKSMSKKDNYRLPVAPYGYRVVNSQLLPYKKEIQICRLVVELREKENLPFRAIARELISKKVKNRKGTVSWGHFTVQSIYQRWKGKV